MPEIGRACCLRVGGRAGPIASLLAVLALVGGCVPATTPARSAAGDIRAGLRSYLRQVEPIRLAVNRLLDTADPILAAYRDPTARPAQAVRRMDALERRFAAYTVEIAAIRTSLAQLRPLQAEYAHTYILEDAYLSALVSGLARHDLRALPHTEAAQRAAIIAWRTGLAVLARQGHDVLPADLEQAGRGEVAPSGS